MNSSVQTAIIVCSMFIVITAIICCTVLVYNRPYRKGS